MPTAREQRDSLLAGRTPLQVARRAEIDALMGSDTTNILDQLKSPGGAVTGLAALLALLSGEGQAAAEIGIGALSGAADRVEDVNAQRQKAILTSLDQFYAQANADADRAARVFGSQPKIFLEGVASDQDVNAILNTDQSLTLKSGYERLKAQNERKDKAAALLTAYRSAGAGSDDTTHAGRKILMSRYNELMDIPMTDDELDAITTKGVSMDYFERVAANSMYPSVLAARKYISDRILKDKVSSDDPETILTALQMLAPIPSAGQLSDAREREKNSMLIRVFADAEQLRSLPENAAMGMTIAQALELLPPEERAVVRTLADEQAIGEWEEIMNAVDASRISSEIGAAVMAHNTAAMQEYGSMENAMADGAILDPARQISMVLQSAYLGTKSYRGLFRQDMANDIVARSFDAAASSLGFTSTDLQDEATLAFVSARAGILREAAGRIYDNAPEGSPARSVSRDEFVRTKMAQLVYENSMKEKAGSPEQPATAADLIRRFLVSEEVVVPVDDEKSPAEAAPTSGNGNAANVPMEPPSVDINPVAEEDVLPGLAGAINEGIAATAREKAREAALQELDNAAKTHEKYVKEIQAEKLDSLRESLAWTKKTVVPGMFSGKTPSDIKQMLLDLYVGKNALFWSAFMPGNHGEFRKLTRTEMYQRAEEKYAEAISKYGDRIKKGTTKRTIDEEDVMEIARLMQVASTKVD